MSRYRCEAIKPRHGEIAFTAAPSPLDELGRYAASIGIQLAVLVVDPGISNRTAAEVSRRQPSRRPSTSTV